MQNEQKNWTCANVAKTKYLTKTPTELGEVCNALHMWWWWVKKLKFHHHIWCCFCRLTRSGKMWVFEKCYSFLSGEQKGEKYKIRHRHIPFCRFFMTLHSVNVSLSCRSSKRTRKTKTWIQWKRTRAIDWVEESTWSLDRKKWERNENSNKNPRRPSRAEKLSICNAHVVVWSRKSIMRYIVGRFDVSEREEQARRRRTTNFVAVDDFVQLEIYDNLLFSSHTHE